MMEFTLNFPLFNSPKQNPGAGRAEDHQIYLLESRLMSTTTTHEIIKSTAFKKLVARRWQVSMLLTLTILVIYIGFLLLVAFNKSVLATKIGQHYTLAIPVGLGIIVVAWLLTGIYVFWANNRYDQAVDVLRKQYQDEN
jgi:uncharacterized membrane protein (DUF485 family)